MTTKYALIGFFVQLATYALLFAENGKAQSMSQVFLTVNYQNVTVEEAFKDIEQKTGFSFLYDRKRINNNIRITAHSGSTSLSEVLTFIAQRSDMRFKRINKTIVVDAESPVNDSDSNEVISVQQSRVSGKVVGAEDGEPLPGVSIVVKGTAIGTTSDVNGSYSLSVPNDAVLLFSYIGFISQEVVVGTQSVIDIRLETDLAQLDEVVVVGFGERRVKDLTGSISTVDSKSLERLNTASPQFALQGNAAGVRVVNASGDPNEAPRIFVRGIGTWNGDAQPLYVVDGQIIEPPRAGNQDVIGGGGLATPPNLFNLINPNDIESISVLKDASAAAIYGSRGANGVILITTKKGKKGAPTVEFNSRFGTQRIPTFDMLNTQQYVDIVNEMYANNVNPDISIERNLFGRNEPNDAIRLTSFNPQYDPQSPFFISDRTTYNWQDELVNQGAVNQSYDMKVSGGGDRVDYYVSAGFFQQEGMLRGNELTRYTGSINLNANVTDWFKIGVNYKYTNQVSELNDVGRLQDYATAPPWQPLRDPNGPFGYAQVIDPFRFGSTWTANKPYGLGSKPNYLAQGNINYESFDFDRSLGQFYAEFKPVKGLTLRGSLNLDYTTQDRFILDAFSRANVFSPNGIDPRTVNTAAPNSLGQMSHRINKVYNYQADFTAIYDRTFGKHRITLTGVVQDQRHTMETQDFSTQNLTNLNPNPRRNGYGNDIANNNSFYGWSQRFWFGYVGRMNYIYDGKYYLDFSYRRDASNGFDNEYRWGNFYAVSGAWRISSEKFMSNLSFINDLKIRGGWGQAGNDQAAVGNYAFLSGVNTGLSTYRWGSGNGNAIGNLSLGALVADFPNATLSWEVVTTTSLGFDALFFNNKINMTFEWYIRETDGILQRVNLPLSVGTNNPLFNIGELQNRGVDLLIGYNGNKGDFTYGISGNISFLQNEVTALYQDQPISTEFGRVEKGRPIGHIWGYRVGGVFQTQQQIDEYFAQFNDQTIANQAFVRPGDLYFLDVQGNPTETERFYSRTPDGLVNPFDQTEIGQTIPGFTYGINLDAGWKGIDFSLNFYGEGDVDKYNQVRNQMESMAGAGPNFLATTLNRWTPQNTGSSMPRAVVGDPAGNNRFSDRWVESAAFFRLNNWQLGYSLPPAVLDKFKGTVRSLRVYVGGQNNLYMFRWSGIDPVNDQIPLPKSYNVGLNARF